MDREIRYVERVRSALGIVQALCAPPRSVKRNGTVIGWVPALRFPTWMRCMNSSCGLLHPAPWRSRRVGGDARREGEEGGSGGSAGECNDCGGRLEQVPWVLVHEDGYLADVPWHDLAHGKSRNPEQRRCSHDWTQPYLQLTDTGTGRLLRCTRCGSNESLRSGALPRFPFPPRTWQQPWMREPPAQSPEAPGWLIEVNDVRVHSPLTRTALVIPPESRIRRGTVLDRLYGSSRNQRRIRSARNAFARRAVIAQLAGEYRCTRGDIEKAVARSTAATPSTAGRSPRKISSSTSTGR